MLEPDRAEEIHYVLYTDETPYRAQKDWLNEMPFDIYSVNVHTGEKQLEDVATGQDRGGR
mgnify:CR=1 FL=1